MTSEGPLCAVSVGALGILLGERVLLVALAGAVGMYPETDKNMQFGTSSEAKVQKCYNSKSTNILKTFFTVERHKVSSYNTVTVDTH